MKKIVGLIGHPLGHSISPAMHNAAFKEVGIDWEYKLYSVKTKDLPSALNKMRDEKLAGFNVTIPHKENVIPLLDKVTELAKLIGAVNTVKNQAGILVGYNTDGVGFIDSLKEDAKVGPKGKKVVVLGAGGASRAVSIMLAETEAASISITDTAEDKAKELVKFIASFFKTSCNFVQANSRALQKEISDADLLVNSTPIGMHPKIDQCPLPKNIELPTKLLVYDLVYNPSETKLLKTAKKSGCKICSGLGMLVRQGALAFTIWTGKEAPVEVMLKAAKKSLG